MCSIQPYLRLTYLKILISPEVYFTIDMGVFCKLFWICDLSEPRSIPHPNYASRLQPQRKYSITTQNRVLLLITYNQPCTRVFMTWLVLSAPKKPRSHPNMAFLADPSAHITPQAELSQHCISQTRSQCLYTNAPPAMSPSSPRSRVCHAPPVHRG